MDSIFIVKFGLLKRQKGQTELDKNSVWQKIVVATLLLAGQSPSSICDNVTGGGGGSFLDLVIRSQKELRIVKVKVKLR